LTGLNIGSLIMNLLKLYKANMINEAEKKARYYEAKATTATDQQTANLWPRESLRYSCSTQGEFSTYQHYRKARIQLNSTLSAGNPY